MTPNTAIWRWDLFAEALPLLLKGFAYTLLVTVLSSALALVLGLVLAMVRRTGFRPVTIPVRFVVEFIRSTPLIPQLFAAYAFLPSTPALVIGVVVLGVHYSTYDSEVYRAGIDGVPVGQWEAATALSLPRSRTWRAVVLPQMIRNILPALGNNIIAMFKDTPYLFVISVGEMMTQAKEFNAANTHYIEALTLAGTIFLLASYPTSVLMRKLEKRLGH